nr:FAS-associated factor 1-like [Halyomorpha halys]
MPDNVPLYNLNLPNVVYLNFYHRGGSAVISNRHRDSRMEVVDNWQTTYMLKIYNEDNHKEYNLMLPGYTNISQVKADTFTLTNIPAGHQIWRGWPENVTEGSKLYELDLNVPFHYLAVQSSLIEQDSYLNNSVISASSAETAVSLMSIDLPDTSSSPDNVEDSSEAVSINEETFEDVILYASRLSPLIPDDVESETAGSSHFIEGFNQRYGPSVPRFYPGTLEDAIKEAFFCPVRQRRSLAIYLHHDCSAFTNSFCRKVLGLEVFLQTLTNYFVIWGYDITYPSNREMFMSSIERLISSTLSETLQNISTTSLPALVIMTSSRSRIEMLQIIYGNTEINKCLLILTNAVELLTNIQQTESKEEEERSAREQIRLEQNKEYQASLLLDRAKDEAKKQQMLLQSQEEERLKKEQEMEEERRKADRMAAVSQLPEEPSDNNQVITIRFRTPKEEVFQRKFLSSNKLQVLFNYLLVKGYRVAEYKLISPWPRRELSSFDGETLLKDIGLCAQETMFLEERLI